MSKLKRTKICRMTLKEQFSNELGFEQGHSLNVPTMSNDISATVIEPWLNEPYSELAAIVAMLKSLNTITQSFHWKTSGESFLGDHLLFQKIYEGVLPQIDSVGEKIVGLGSGVLANPLSIEQGSTAFTRLVVENQSIKIGSNSEADKMFRTAGYAVAIFIETVEGFMKDMDKKGYLTIGLENLLAGILDEHETFLYLLKQRTK